MLLLLASLLLAVPQDEPFFVDAEFAFVFAPPARMSELATQNPTRAGWTRTGEAFTRTHTWIDVGDQGRALELTLVDEHPYASSEAFARAVDPDGDASVRPARLEPPIGPGVVHEHGYRDEELGRLLRQRSVYLLDLGEQRAAVLRMSAFDEDWADARPAFDAVLRGIRWNRQLPEQVIAARVADGHLGAGGLGTGRARADGARDSGDWDELEVWGSLVLAVVTALVLLLGVGGRAAT